MRPLKDFFIPNEYADNLSQLRDRAFSWKMEFSSKSDVSNVGHITHYSLHNPNVHGNLVLAPGLASNSEIEPLMCAITYWGLVHGYDIYAIDTFFGDFKPGFCAELASRNTVPEFINVMDVGLDIVSKMSLDKWTCVIGHSLGGLGTLEVFNRRVLDKKPINFSGVILFAPFIVSEWHEFTKRFIHHYQYPDLPYEEFYAKPVGLMSPHDIFSTNKTRFVSVFPKIYDDIDKIKPRPDLMAQYNMPITIVAGGLDRKSPAEYMRAVYNEARKKGANIKFVEFPQSRHSFMNQHNDWNAILKLIQSQHQKRAK